MKKNKNIIYKSLFSNDIYINEYLLNEKKIKSYEITYSNFLGKKENIKIENFRDFSLNRLINYGTLDIKNDEITLKAEFEDKTNYLEKIKGNYWGLNIEKIYPNQIRGWLIFKKNLILRPFYLRINNQEIAYSIKILGERDDVSNAYNLKDGIAKEFELKLASKIVNDFSSIELFYKNINKDSVFYKNKFALFSWKNNLKCNFLDNYENKKIKNIAILMPIYDGVEETIIAINSVLSGLKKQNYYNYRFILGLDNPSNLKMKDEILNKFSHNSLFTIIINEENKGFIGNCNNLFSKISVFEDILLLNSDIEAPKSFDWIQKLIDVAESDNKIGTVTPMSNAASIFSFPNPNEYQGRFKNKTIEQINDLFADNTEIIEVPSCHGFCTLIVNTRLKLNYLFDEMFGKGYGEENDLSMRINNLGYKNVSCSSVYIYHHESISFSEKKEEFIKKNLKILGDKYIFYHGMIQEFCSEDPLRNIRNSVLLKFFSNESTFKNNFLHLCHNRGGGTFKYILDTIKKNNLSHHFLAYPDEESNNILISELIDNKIDIVKIKLTLSELASNKNNIFEKLNIKEIFLHSLIDFPEYGLDGKISEILSKVTSTILVHDYHWLSQNECLLDHKNQYVGLVKSQTYENLETILIREINNQKVVNESKESYLKRMYKILNTANKIICPSYSAFNLMREIHKKLNYEIIYHDDSHLIAHEDELDKLNFDSEINVGIFGAIGHNKGYDLLLKLSKYVEKYNEKINFTIFGYTLNDYELSLYRCVNILGKYSNDSELNSLIKSNRPDCSLFLSQWPETFSYTLSVSFENKIYPFVLNKGAMAERVSKSKFGTILFRDDEKSIIDTIKSKIYK